MRWYPSVGGRTLAKHTAADGSTVIDRVAWTNLAFAQEPVNRGVQPVQVLPLGEFLKAVTAGYETDVAQLEGGQAVQEQSINRRLIRYRDVAARYLKAVGTGGCDHTAGRTTVAKLVDHFIRCEHLPEDVARRYTAAVFRHMATRQTQSIVKEAA
jgi:hypothetical protein